MDTTEKQIELSRRFKTVKKLIGMSIRGRRKIYGWNQLYLADLADINKSAVVNIELGGRYSADELLAVIKHLDGKFKIEWNEEEKKEKART